MVVLVLVLVLVLGLGLRAVMRVMRTSPCLPSTWWEPRHSIRRGRGGSDRLSRHQNRYRLMCSVSSGNAARRICQDIDSQQNTPILDYVDTPTREGAGRVRAARSVSFSQQER